MPLDPGIPIDQPIYITRSNISLNATGWNIHRFCLCVSLVPRQGFISLEHYSGCTSQVENCVPPWLGGIATKKKFPFENSGISIGFPSIHQLAMLKFMRVASLQRQMDQKNHRCVFDLEVSNHSASIIFNQTALEISDLQNLKCMPQTCHQHPSTTSRPKHR